MGSAQQSATRRYRERRRNSGLKRLEVQVPSSDAAVIKKAAAVLREQSEDAARLRQQLGFDPPLTKGMGAAEVFAMTEPLSEEGERLWEEAMAQVARERKGPVLNRARKLKL
jgi:hypothetical protein